MPKLWWMLSLEKNGVKQGRYGKSGASVVICAAPAEPTCHNVLDKIGKQQHVWKGSSPSSAVPDLTSIVIVRTAVLPLMPRRGAGASTMAGALGGSLGRFRPVIS